MGDFALVSVKWEELTAGWESKPLDRRGKHWMLGCAVRTLGLVVSKSRGRSKTGVLKIRKSGRGGKMGQVLK